MGMIKAIQIIAEFKSEPEARGAFDFLISQDDCYAGRVYFNDTDGVWKVQTINAPGDEWHIGRELPESMSYVLCPTSLLAQMENAVTSVHQSFVDVSTITEYGLTQKLSNSIRVF